MVVSGTQLKPERNEMSKVFNRPVEVQIKKNLLAAFLWRGMWRFVVDIRKILLFRDCLDPYYCLDTYRVQNRIGGVYYFVRYKEKWFLEMVWD